MSELSESYSDAIKQASNVIATVTNPFWQIVRHTPWKNDFLGCLFKWGALISRDIPCAIVPLSSNVPDVMESIRHIMLQEHQCFPMPKKLIWRGLRRASLDGLSGFQANVASCGAISQLIGEGFVVFTDEARLYPQYASNYVEKLNEHWPDWSGEPIADVKHLKVIYAICLLDGISDSEKYLTPTYHIRAYRASKRMNVAYIYRDREIAPVRRWLQSKYPDLHWDTWHGSGIIWDAREILEKVNAYVDRKDSAREMRDAWEQYRRVNEERLQLWRDWYRTSIQALVK